MTMDNYLENRFKLDSNAYCKKSSIRKQVSKLNEIKYEVNDSTLYHANLIEQLVSQHVESVGSL